MTHPLVIAALKTLTLCLGAVITYYSYKAYRRTKTRALGALALGFGIVTMGAFLAGALDTLAPFNRQLAFVVESAFTAVGFAAIFYALFVDTAR